MHPREAAAEDPLPRHQHVVAVAAARALGSPRRLNLALALHPAGPARRPHGRRHLRPSVLHHDGRAGLDPQPTAFPLERYGISLMSSGFLVKPEQAVIWRGRCDRYIRQFLMPPGATSITW